MDARIAKLIPTVKQGEKHTNKNLRRNIRRLADRKGITYEKAILLFFKVGHEGQLDKNLVYSLRKNWNRFL